MSGSNGRGGSPMWGYSLEFWDGVFFWTAGVAAVAGAISVTSALVSAVVAYKVTDFVQREADKRISEANEGAAKANERAGKLQLEAERLKQTLSWRRLTSAQYDAIFLALKGRPMLEASVQWVATDSESWQFADDLIRALRASGVVVREVKGLHGDIGLKISSGTSPLGNIFKDAFAAAGLPMDETVLPGSGIVIVVGTKPSAF
jgi:hypothetical protein